MAVLPNEVRWMINTSAREPGTIVNIEISSITLRQWQRNHGVGEVLKTVPDGASVEPLPRPPAEFLDQASSEELRSIGQTWFPDGISGTSHLLDRPFIGVSSGSPVPRWTLLPGELPSPADVYIGCGPRALFPRALFNTEVDTLYIRTETFRPGSDCGLKSLVATLQAHRHEHGPCQADWHRARNIAICWRPPYPPAHPPETWSEDMKKVLGLFPEKRKVTLVAQHYEEQGDGRLYEFMEPVNFRFNWDYYDHGHVSAERIQRDKEKEPPAASPRDLYAFYASRQDSSHRDMRRLSRLKMALRFTLFIKVDVKIVVSKKQKALYEARRDDYINNTINLRKYID